MDRPGTSSYEGLQSADMNSEIKYSESWGDGEYKDIKDVKDAKFFHIQKSAVVLAFAVQENRL